jgi:hypothetical protein
MITLATHRAHVRRAACPLRRRQKQPASNRNRHIEFLAAPTHSGQEVGRPHQGRKKAPCCLPPESALHSALHGRARFERSSSRAHESCETRTDSRDLQRDSRCGLSLAINTGWATRDPSRHFHRQASWDQARGFARLSDRGRFAHAGTAHLARRSASE